MGLVFRSDGLVHELCDFVRGIQDGKVEAIGRNSRKYLVLCMCNIKNKIGEEYEKTFYNCFSFFCYWPSLCR